VARSRRLERREAEAIACIEAFAREGPCYAGVSWGKDSTVLAHLVTMCSVTVPLVWVRVEPIANPDCSLVRDEFLSAHDIEYVELEVWCTWSDGEYHATGTLEQGFAEAGRRYGARHISGVRADESGARKTRMRRHGHNTRRTSAPIGWWTGEEVYAYLYRHALPVHPAYAMSLRGLLDRNRIRVASLGGKRGEGFGRAEWEQRYYPDAMRRLACPPD